MKRFKHTRAYVRAAVINAKQIAPTEADNSFGGEKALSWDELETLHFACVQLEADEDGFNLAIVHPITGMLYRAMSIDFDFATSDELVGHNAITYRAEEARKEAMAILRELGKEDIAALAEWRYHGE